MEKLELLVKLAPCSFMCYTCPAYTKGVICELSGQLSNYYRGYHRFMVAHIPDEHLAFLKDFDVFKAQLDKSTAGGCDGCRNNPNTACTITGCFIEQCTREHAVDYCGECAEFPCGKVTSDLFTPINLSRYQRGNKRISQVGAEQFFEEMKDISHFIDFE